MNIIKQIMNENGYNEEMLKPKNQNQPQYMRKKIKGKKKKNKQNGLCLHTMGNKQDL
jgi:hypothetical protein